MNIIDVDFRDNGFEKYMDRITGYKPSEKIVDIQTEVTNFFICYGLMPVSLYVSTLDAFRLSVALDKIDLYTVSQKVLETYREEYYGHISADLIIRHLYDDTEEILKIHSEIVDKFPSISIISFIQYFVKKVRGS